MNNGTDRARRARRFGCVAVGVFALLGGWSLTGPSAQARIVSMLASPTAVATIDVDAVLAQLDERAELEQKLQELGARLENEVNTLKTEAEDMAGDLELYEPGTEKYKDLRREIEIANARWRLQGEFANRVVRQEQGDLRRRLFNKIMDATREYAELEGWDIVLIDDAQENVSEQMNSEQFGAYISTRGVAYRSDTVDITDEVATALNNDYRSNVAP